MISDGNLLFCCKNTQNQIFNVLIQTKASNQDSRSGNSSYAYECEHVCIFSASDSLCAWVTRIIKKYVAHIKVTINIITTNSEFYVHRKLCSANKSSGGEDGDGKKKLKRRIGAKTCIHML